MLLADQGADVIRIDPPGGPRWKTPANLTWNRGKRSITLDLKRADDSAIARSLIQSADVVVENFRPGAMDRLRLGPEEMTRANPRLVYCSIPGFASDDPRAAMPAYEGVVGAASATFRPPNADNPRPVYTAIPIASVYGAFQSVVAIVVALNARERDGVGQRIEVPLFDSMFQSLGRFGVRVHNAPPAIPTLQELWGGIFQCSDGQFRALRRGQACPDGVLPRRTADGDGGLVRLRVLVHLVDVPVHTHAAALAAVGVPVVPL